VVDRRRRRHEPTRSVEEPEAGSLNRSIQAGDDGTLVDNGRVPTREGDAELEGRTIHTASRLEKLGDEGVSRPTVPDSNSFGMGGPEREGVQGGRASDDGGRRVSVPPPFRAGRYR